MKVHEALACSFDDAHTCHWRHGSAEEGLDGLDGLGAGGVATTAGGAAAARVEALNWTVHRGSTQVTPSDCTITRSNTLLRGVPTTL